MEYSGPIPLGGLETNSGPGDEDGESPGKVWPPLLPSRPPDSAAATTSPAGPPPTAETTKGRGPLPPPLTDSRQSAALCHAPPSSHAPPAPAFAPRSEYIRLMFRDSPGVDVKLRWLSEVTKAYQLDRELAEVKMSAITSRFVYISRLRQDIVDNVKNGEFLSLYLDTQDLSERPRKFPTYLMTRFPIGIDPSLA